MWKLWPKAWTLGRNAADQRKAAAAEELHARWRRRLAHGLTGVLAREVSQEEAPSRLDELTGEQLLALDLALRRRQWSGSSLDPRSTANSAPELWQDDDAATRFLFVATCDGIGFIREEALRQLRVYPGHLALSAALIRITDWVPEVQAVAESLLDHLLKTLRPSALLDQLDLLVSLRRRERLHASLWEGRILPMLSAPEALDGRLRWISEGPWAARLFALKLVMVTDPEARVNAVRQAVTSNELPVALWAVSTSPELTGEPCVELLTLAIGHPAATVRAAALRQAHLLDPAIARPMLANAIFDLARAPRTAAVRELERHFDERARVHWRRALAANDTRRWKGAFFGLCDAPEAEDIPAISNAVGHPSATIRSAALRGLLRARAPILDGYLKRALFDKSKIVVRQALEIYRGDSFALDCATLESAIFRSADVTRRALISATRQLQKWDALDVLLKLAMTDSTRVEATQEMAQWISRSNRRFTSPAADLLLKIRERLEVLSTALPDSLSSSLQDILEHT